MRFAYNHSAKALTSSNLLLCIHSSDKSQMGQRMTEAKRVQVSLHLEEPLREQLEEAARRSVRSLSGEVTFRLKRSLECDREIDSDAA
jgi:hypothetical protein